jgi:cytochrome c5
MLMVKIFITIFCILLQGTSFSATHKPQDFLNQVRGTQDEGSKIVTHFCASCHADKPLIAIGAPRIGNSDDWKPRLKQGLNSLLEHVNAGFNAMPPRGGCFECSDEQILLSIRSMLNKKDQDDLFHINKH